MNVNIKTIICTEDISPHLASFPDFSFPGSGSRSGLGLGSGLELGSGSHGGLGLGSGLELGSGSHGRSGLDLRLQSGSAWSSSEHKNALTRTWGLLGFCFFSIFHFWSGMQTSPGDSGGTDKSDQESAAAAHSCAAVSESILTLKNSHRQT